MKRKTKNIIIVSLIIILSVLLFFTISYVKNNVNSTNQTEEKQNGMTPPNMPNMSNENNENENNTPPEKPDDNSNGNEMKENKGNSGNTPPAMPEENNMSKMPQMPNDMSNNSSIKPIYYVIIGGESLLLVSLIIYLVMASFNKKSIKETFINKDKILIFILTSIILTFSLTYLSSYAINNKTNISNNNQNNNSIVYSAKEEITTSKDINGKTYEESEKDSNAILISGDVDVNLSDVTVNKTGDSDGGDSTSFYGTNSAILAKNGANVTIDNINVTTSATGANGVFSYGGSATTNNTNSDGTTITISNSKITTNKDNSGGIMTTGGGTMIANNLEIETSGTSSAAIRTDRGGGNVTVNKGTYKTTGKGSPSIYSTANIKVTDATLISTASEGIVIEGKNSVSLDNVILTDTNNTLNGQSTTYKNIFIYQSMSGDAATGEAIFTAKDSKITTNKGDTFYITNTTATINIENNSIINNDNSGNFLRIKKDSWGNEGSNGGNVTLNMTNQKVLGNIVVDEISTLKINMTSNSYYEGSINNNNEAKEITLVLDKTSSLKLTGDTYLTSFTDEDKTNSNIDFNGYKLYVNNVAIN